MVRFIIVFALFCMTATPALLAQSTVPLPVQSGDSLLLESQKDSCFHSRLLNRHSPASDLNDWHLTVLTSGVALGGLTGSSKWHPTIITPTSASYAAPPGSEIHPGDTGVTFDQGFVNIPEDGSFEIAWSSTLDGDTIYTETMTLHVEFEIRGDLIGATPTGDCCYNLTLKNDHVPMGLLNGLHLSIITGGVSFRPGTISGTTQWPLSSEPSATTAGFKALVGHDLLPGQVHSGFKACFDYIPVPGLIEIGWYTLLDSTIIFRDTLELQCATTGIERIPGSLPSCFILHQNFPNPFNPSTTIEFEVPYSSDVELDIFNQSGQSVFVLVHTYLEAGRYAIRFDASSLPSGLYF